MNPIMVDTRIEASDGGDRLDERVMRQKAEKHERRWKQASSRMLTEERKEENKIGVGEENLFVLC